MFKILAFLGWYRCKVCYKLTRHKCKGGCGRYVCEDCQREGFCIPCWLRKLAEDYSEVDGR
jgi:hypothetical protein